MSRIIDCSCGHQLRAADNEALFIAARRHIDEQHPDMVRSDEQILQSIRDRARDDVAAAR